MVFLLHQMFWSSVHEDHLTEGNQGHSHGSNSSQQVDHVLALILVVNLDKSYRIWIFNNILKITCFHDSVGTPISSILGLVQLARALPLLGTIISLELLRNTLGMDMIRSESVQIISKVDFSR